MIRHKSSFVILFLLSLVITAQSKFQIRITGSEFVTEKTLSNLISSETKINDSVKEKIANSINSVLSDEGFYNSQIIIDTTSVSEKEKTILISINEGKKTLIRNISINTKDSLSISELNKYFVYAIGKEMRRREIENIIFQILADHENKGYPFASIDIEKIDFHSDSLGENNYCTLYLSFNKSDKSLIDKIVVEGNSKTKEYVIKRNIRMKEGEEFSADKINSIPSILNRLKYFEPVESPEYFYDDENKGVLKIKVKEKVTNNFDGIIGYVPEVKNKSKGFFTGFINVGLRNIFGTERSGMIKWQKDEQLSQELEINYTEPWIFNYPVSMSLFIWQRREDSTYVQRKYEGKIEYLLNDEISTSFLIGMESTIPSESDSRGFTVFNSSSLTLGGNVKYDTRDDAYNPTKGFVFTTTYKLYQKKIFGPEEYLALVSDKKNELQKIEFNISYFQKIFTAQVLAISFHARELRGNSIEISDLYKLGGAFTLRGYLENQFWGNRIFWSNFEYRYLFDKRSFVFGFFDEGYFLLSKSTASGKSELTGFRSGYGFGLNLETGIGVLGVSFALGQGDAFGEGKLHFGILSEF